MKQCAVCGKEFEPLSPNQRCCTPECSKKRLLERRQTPEYKARACQYQHTYYQKPQVKEAQRDYMREYIHRPAAKARRYQYRQRPYVKEQSRQRRKLRRQIQISELWSYQDGRCAYCGCRLDGMSVSKQHLEHVWPLNPRKPHCAIHGSNEIQNILVVCDVCNHHKNDSDPREWYKQHPPTADPYRFPVNHSFRQIMLAGGPE